jgi:23S rRNA (pseudouridine1915-N3)-methyltransferase
MRITLISIGKRMPTWVEQAYAEYTKRLPHDYRLELIEIDLAKRGKNADTKRLITREGEQMLQSIPNGDKVVALEVLGRQLTTPQLAEFLYQRHEQGQNISLLVGGPEGLAPACSARAEHKWSLAALTLPHPLVRVILAEQIYRAWSIIQGHPYHRE